jgi:anti-sigma regulatory factor (Ser/Thr protein kinase)
MPVIPFPSPSPMSAPTTTSPRVPTIPSHWTFPAHPASVPRARRAVADALPVDITAQLASDLSLLTSELVTNAIRYGACRNEDQLVELILWPADGHYWLAVSDPGDGWPVTRACDLYACDGRGLVLVERVSAAWAVVPRHPCGKSVVAGVRLHRG